MLFQRLQQKATFTWQSFLPFFFPACGTFCVFVLILVNMHKLLKKWHISHVLLSKIVKMILVGKSKSLIFSSQKYTGVSASKESRLFLSYCPVPCTAGGYLGSFPHVSVILAKGKWITSFPSWLAGDFKFFYIVSQVHLRSAAQYFGKCHSAWWGRRLLNTRNKASSFINSFISSIHSSFHLASSFHLLHFCVCKLLQAGVIWSHATSAVHDGRSRGPVRLTIREEVHVSRQHPQSLPPTLEVLSIF